MQRLSLFLSLCFFFSLFFFSFHHPCVFHSHHLFMCTQQSMLHGCHRCCTETKPEIFWRGFLQWCEDKHHRWFARVVGWQWLESTWFTGLISIFHINAPCCSSWRCCSTWHVRKPLFWISPTRCKHPEQTPSLTVIHYLEQPVESVINGKSSVFHLRDQKWVLSTSTCSMTSTNRFQRSSA